jgi:hypothetical protein
MNPKTLATCTCLFLFATLATACSVFGGEDDAPSVTTQEMPPVEGAPVPSELTEKFGVFATPGNANGDGTRARPVGTLARAIEIARLTKKSRVYACAGTFVEQLALADGIAIVGGLDCSHPSWSLGAGRSKLESPASPAVIADKITALTRLERFDVVASAGAASGTPSARSSIGLLATDAPGLAILDASIAARDGAAGADGTEGIPLVESGTSRGKDASYPQLFGVLPNPPPPARANAPGATSLCVGEAGHDGESGGDGGFGGIYEWKYDGQVFYEKWTRLFNDPAYGSQSGQARSGADGARGVDGVSAAAGAFGRDGFAPAEGARGTAGQPGKGGAGGYGFPADIPNANRRYAYGSDGASGGAGGCPGLPGEPGQGGGASVAVLLFASPIVLENVALTAGDGGNGGKGTFGSAALAGGAPGTVYHASQLPAQSGGRGGEAGVSGSGAGGPSIAIVHDGGAGGAPRVANATLAHGRGGAGVSALVLGSKTITPSASGTSANILSL